MLPLLSPTHIIKLHKDATRLQLMLHSCPQSSLILIGWGPCNSAVISGLLSHAHPRHYGLIVPINCTPTPPYQPRTSALKEQIRQNDFGQKVRASCSQLRRPSGSLLRREVCRRWRSRCPRAVLWMISFFTHAIRTAPIHNPQTPPLCQLSFSVYRKLEGEAFAEAGLLRILPQK